MNSSLSNFLGKKKDEYEVYHEKIVDMLGDQEGFGWAESTLAGILESIENKGQISEGQKQAVDNIYHHA